MLALRDDPIMAIATPPGRGAVGVLRISGRSLQAYAEFLCQQALKPRCAQLLTLRDSQGNALDQVLAIYFPSPHSYTGEDVLELQGHGGTVVMHMVMAHCLALAQSSKPDGTAWLPHLRLAQAGEFTQRAFLNQKLDLAQAEAVADLIDASTEAAVRSAGRSMQGAFSDQVHALKAALVHLRVQIEACLDFPEEDLDFIEQFQVRAQLHHLLTQTTALTAQAKQGALLRDGLKLVIAGQPNAGKSSLLNALAGAELAIVTPIAGTTRDVLGQSIQIEGVPIHVLDTAGLRALAQADEVEQIGIQRAWAQIQQADMVILLNDVSRTDPAYMQQQQQLQQEIEACLPKHTSLLLVDNKMDMVDSAATTSQTVRISAKKGEGLSNLRMQILKLAGWQTSAQDGVFTARARHLDALAMVLHHLRGADALLNQAQPALDLLAEECRLAQHSLVSLTGDFSADDLLGEIFSSFCIGK
jgi:tRNA modification GTPase